MRAFDPLSAVSRRRDDVCAPALGAPFVNFLDCLVWLLDHSFERLLWPSWMGEHCVTNMKAENTCEAVARYTASPSFSHPATARNSYCVIEIARNQIGQLAAYVYECPERAHLGDLIVTEDQGTLLPPRLQVENVMEGTPGWFIRPYLCIAPHDLASSSWSPIASIEVGQ